MSEASTIYINGKPAKRGERQQAAPQTTVDQINDTTFVEKVVDSSGNIIGQQEYTEVGAKLEDQKLIKQEDGKLANEEAIKAIKEAETLSIKRATITGKVGDTDSLVGTALDGIHLLIAKFEEFTATVANAGSIKEIQAAAATQADSLAKFKEVNFPFALRGEAATIDKIATRANETTKALSGE